MANEVIFMHWRLSMAAVFALLFCTTEVMSTVQCKAATHISQNDFQQVKEKSGHSATRAKRLALYWTVDDRGQQTLQMASMGDGSVSAFANNASDWKFNPLLCGFFGVPVFERHLQASGTAESESV
ncbi:hypothetical protein [Alicyclobacillus tolerans]|uniref:Uncharacterized protein n=2 Tax=Alicyclobacillus tolerans TaxID=90970 RepID=A0ABT9LSN0_9BACL|nr:MULTISPECIES: hypothetical protein [Alicyclobacillus]MDP9727258.1 hypothetical protein [Alicyclobacillus tengchongensis]